MFYPHIESEECTVFVLGPDGQDQMIDIREFYPTAAGVAVGRYGKTGKIEYALIKRGKEPGINLWDIPGGKKDLDDINLSGWINYRGLMGSVAVREAREEIGININPYFGGPVFGFSYEQHRVVYFQTFIFGKDPRRDISLQPGEGVLDADWFSEKDCKKLDLSAAALEILPQLFPI